MEPSSFEEFARAKEIELKERELDLKTNSQILDRRRMVFVGIGVPIAIAIVSLVPTAIFGFFQNQIDERAVEQRDLQARAERRLEELKIVASVVLDNSPQDAARKLLALQSTYLFTNFDDEDVERIFAELVSTDIRLVQLCVDHNIFTDECLELAERIGVDVSDN